MNNNNKAQLTILGSNSATPAYDRTMTSQALYMQEQWFLIDCAEGTQMQLAKYKIRAQRFNHIFISHLHGDHVFGLIGLLMSLSLNHRSEELVVHAPLGLKELIETQIRLTHSHLSFPLRFSISDPTRSERLYEDDKLSVDSIPLLHRVPTHGFLFREKPKLRNMSRETLLRLSIPVSAIPAIKAGGDWIDEKGQVHLNSSLTIDPPAPRSYAFCSDTLYSETILPFIEGVDLLYHEATFMHDMIEQAELTMHSTALQAAQIARAASVKQLVIGHFSSRYKDLAPLLAEAQSVFPNTILAIEGLNIGIGE